MTLRPYQSCAIERTIRQIWNRPILVAPTGSGKTVMATHLVRRMGVKCLWVAHRRELIFQAKDHLDRLGMRTGVIMAGHPEREDAEVHVASIQTLARRRIPSVGLVVVDEAHHASAESYRSLFQLGVPIVGLTATPFRLDGRSLGDMFDSLVISATTRELCDEGYLIKPKVYGPPEKPDLNSVKIRRGDYELGGLGEAVNTRRLVGNIVDHWNKHAEDMKTVCFAVNVEHSKAIAERFDDAEHIDGRTPKDERDAVLARLSSGETKIVCNCQILTEGWDLPELECAIIARPTASLCLHLQMLGRICRAGKDSAIVLDHAGNHLRHGDICRELEYSLETEVASQPGDPLGMRQCPECFLLVSIYAAACPDCGHVFESPPGDIAESGDSLREFRDFDYYERAWKAIEDERLRWDRKPGWSAYEYRRRFGEFPVVVEGELIDPSDPSNKQRVYDHFVAIANEKGFKLGWASHQYRRVFGVWPRGVNREAIQSAW